MSPRTVERANAQVELGPHFAFLTLDGGTQDTHRSRAVNSRHQRSLSMMRIAAIGALTAPAPVTDDEWKHVKKLYATFNQSLLWLDDKGVHQPRVSALLNALADADSDALELSAYPLTALGQALDSIDHGHPTADQLANADVMLSAAYATFG